MCVLFSYLCHLTTPKCQRISTLAFLCFCVFLWDVFILWNFLLSKFPSLLACLLIYLLSYLSKLFRFPPSNDVTVTDQEGNTALHVAAISSKTECMRVLLRAGATDSLSLGMFIQAPSFLLILNPFHCFYSLILGRSRSLAATHSLPFPKGRGAWPRATWTDWELGYCLCVSTADKR